MRSRAPANTAGKFQFCLAVIEIIQTRCVFLFGQTLDLEFMGVVFGSVLAADSSSLRVCFLGSRRWDELARLLESAIYRYSQ